MYGLAGTLGIAGGAVATGLLMFGVASPAMWVLAAVWLVWAVPLCALAYAWAHDPQ